MRTLNAFESQQLTAGRLAQQEQLREARCREIDQRRGDELAEELAALDAEIDRQRCELTATERRRELLAERMTRRGLRVSL